MVDVISTIMAAFAVFGGLCALLVCACFFAFAEQRTLQNKLVLYLSSTDAGLCIVLAINVLIADSGNPCRGAGLVLQFFLLSSILWNTALGHHLLASVHLRWSGERLVRAVWFYAIIAVAVPLAIALLLLIGGIDVYGPVGTPDEGYWCWISHEYRYLRLVAFYVPGACLVLFNIVAMILANKEFDATLARRERHVVYIALHSTVFLSAFILRLIADYSPSFSTSPYSQSSSSSDDNKYNAAAGIESAIAALTAIRCGIFNIIVFASAKIAPPPTLDDILHTAGGPEKFLEFLILEHSEENLLFVQDVRQYVRLVHVQTTPKIMKHSTSLSRKEQWRESANRIWNRYLINGAPQQVNVTWNSLERVRHCLEEPTETMFREVSDEIMKVLQTHSFPRFKKTSLYRGLEQEHQQRCASRDDGIVLLSALIQRMWSAISGNTTRLSSAGSGENRSFLPTSSSPDFREVEMQRPASSRPASMRGEFVGVQIASSEYSLAVTPPSEATPRRPSSSVVTQAGEERDEAAAKIVVHPSLTGGGGDIMCIPEELSRDGSFSSSSSPKGGSGGGGGVGVVAQISPMSQQQHGLQLMSEIDGGGGGERREDGGVGMNGSMENSVGSLGLTRKSSGATSASLLFELRDGEEEDAGQNRSNSNSPHLHRPPSSSSLQTNQRELEMEERSAGESRRSSPKRSPSSSFEPDSGLFRPLSSPPTSSPPISGVVTQFGSESDLMSTNDTAAVDDDGGLMLLVEPTMQPVQNNNNNNDNDDGENRKNRERRETIDSVVDEREDEKAELMGR